MRYHFICILLKDDVLLPKKIYTSQNPVDTLIKVVIVEKLKALFSFCGVFKTVDRSWVASNSLWS